MRKMMRERRVDLGLSQEQVANEAGMTRANYAHIERGRHEPSLEQMTAIARALRVDNPTVLFFRNECDETYQDAAAETLRSAV